MLNIPDSTMDMFLREAVEKYGADGMVDDTFFKMKEKRQSFVTFCRSLGMPNGKLCYKGRSDDEPKVVPTPQEVDECLNKKHYRVVGNHLEDKQTLVKALSSEGYSSLVNLGGLAALVNE